MPYFAVLNEKYGFRLHNFCIMSTHIHLLVTPASNTNLSRRLYSGLKLIQPNAGIVYMGPKCTGMESVRRVLYRK